MADKNTVIEVIDMKRLEGGESDYKTEISIEQALNDYPFWSKGIETGIENNAEKIQININPDEAVYKKSAPEDKATGVVITFENCMIDFVCNKYSAYNDKELFESCLFDTDGKFLSPENTEFEYDEIKNLSLEDVSGLIEKYAHYDSDTNTFDGLTSEEYDSENKVDNSEDDYTNDYVSDDDWTD